MNDKPTCKTCEYWYKTGNSVDGDYGLCKRYPKNSTSIKQIYEHDWCGEHQAYQLMRVALAGGVSTYTVNVDKKTGIVDFEDPRR